MLNKTNKPKNNRPVPDPDLELLHSKAMQINSRKVIMVGEEDNMIKRNVGEFIFDFQ